MKEDKRAVTRKRKKMQIFCSCADAAQAAPSHSKHFDWLLVTVGNSGIY